MPLLRPLSVALSVAAAFCSQPALARTNVGLVDYTYVSPDSSNCHNLSANKYTAGTDDTYLVQKDSVYEVTLKRVKMDNFVADFWNRSKGEFAVVARAFEMAPSATNLTVGFDFRHDAAVGGRVIYYSNDVWRQQAMNFGQIPMFGPVVYNGNPVGISVFMLEVDTGSDNAQMGTLLSTLAAIGQVVSVPGSPVFSLLENLGSSLINANKDDLLMRYDTTFRSNQDSIPNIKTTLFRYGDYVLMRVEKRDEPIPWSKYWYAPQNGTIYKDEKCTTPFTESAYGVIQVNRANAPAYIQTEQLGSLLSAINNSDQANQKPIAEAVRAVADTMNNARNYRAFIRLLETLQDNKNSSKSSSTSQKASLASALRKTAASIEQHKAGKAAEYSQEQLDQIIARLQRLTGDNRIDRDNFNPATIANGVQ